MGAWQLPWDDLSDTSWAAQRVLARASHICRDRVSHANAHQHASPGPGFRLPEGLGGP